MLEGPDLGPCGMQKDAWGHCNMGLFQKVMGLEI